MIKVLVIVGLEKTYFNIVKVVQENPAANIENVVVEKKYLNIVKAIYEQTIANTILEKP